MSTVPDDELQAALAALPGWTVHEGALVKQFELPSFLAAVDFVNALASLAEEANHHPDLDIRYDKVRVALVTHSQGGITGKDLEMAQRIETEHSGRTA
ncbi:MAG TPA: 4a-hydroxytetrahydrobiopterin dehydratase [Acidimicrobiales bacterium]|nr:4a-hydroxytetrahydrobiopterin dehydratase [Acidimicrobiales bacterium]